MYVKLHFFCTVLFFIHVNVVWSKAPCFILSCKFKLNCWSSIWSVWKSNSVFKIKMTYIVQLFFLHVPFLEFDPLPVKGSLHVPVSKCPFSNMNKLAKAYPHKKFTLFPPTELLTLRSQNTWSWSITHNSMQCSKTAFQGLVFVQSAGTELNDDIL